MQEFIKDILMLEHEPLIPDENEKILQIITSLERTSQFEEHNISEEKLDELLENLDNQDSYTEQIDTLIIGLEEVPASAMRDVDIDYI